VRTERLLLRQWRASDLDAYAEIIADPEVGRYLGDGSPVDRNGAWRQMAAYIGHLVLRGYSHWAVELLETGEFIGRAGPWMPEGWPALEIGWTISPRHQRRGYATEAARVAQRCSWENLHADRLVSLVRPGNEPSAAVARKLGGVLDEEIDLMGGRAWVFEYARPGP
jgi:[ribosomal protein S5]-alanine N-acetyltransferase